MQKFCTHDGGRLVPDIEREKPFDPNATVTANPSNIDIPSFMPATERDLEATLATPPPNRPPVSAPSTSEFRSTETSPTLPETNRMGQPQQPAPEQFATIAGPVPPSPPIIAPGPSVELPSAPLSPDPRSADISLPPAPVALPETRVPSPPAQLQVIPKKSRLGPMLAIAGVILLLLLVVGGLAAYFLYFKGPRRGREVTVTPTLKNTENTNTGTTNLPSTDNKPKPVESPPNTARFENSTSNLDSALAAQYVDFHFYYPKSWQKTLKPGAANFVEVERFIPPDFTQERLVVSWYKSKGTVDADLKGFPALIKERNANLAKSYPEYQKLAEGKTTVNGIEGYEFRFKAFSRGTVKGDIYIWGRVVFLPPGDESSTKGVTLYMLTTSLAPELKSEDDVGIKGELPIILNSFTLGKS
jgi:hypothetical protein